jgi:2,4-dienoyl-CoA reductase-like NADH-dependent reductase (Old Yellow Enzyme family)
MWLHMTRNRYIQPGSFRDVESFRRHLGEQGIEIPCDRTLDARSASPLAEPLRVNGIAIGNRIAIHPMEGWDGEPDGRPSDLTIRRWQRFGRSGAKLIWGGEAVAVVHDGRANPNQLLIGEHARDGLARLRDILIKEHRQTTGSTDGLLIGLQLTHSGRYSRPNAKTRPEPRILYHHPILDERVGVTRDYPLLSDGEIRAIIEAFHEAARLARAAGFDFVDIKHCHGYLGHEFLSARTREGDYGGSLENRTRFLREVVQGVRAVAPGLGIGVRLSAVDTPPFRPDPARSSPGNPGPGAPVPLDGMLPYVWGFGLNPDDPMQIDLDEVFQFIALLRSLDIHLVNVSAGSPYYNPHVLRPALYPPSDGYQPPEDPLLGVERQMLVARALKERFPAMVFVGTAYTYLQDFLPYVAQAAVREGWIDAIGLGRMALTYPELLWDALEGRAPDRKRVCRTFSDCTTGPRNGLVSGCFPLDDFYKTTDTARQLKNIKDRGRGKTA